MSPRIGVFGGTLRPMHLAHRDVARALRDDELALDKVHIRAGRPALSPRVAPQITPNSGTSAMLLTLGDEAGLWVDARAVRHARPTR